MDVKKRDIKMFLGGASAATVIMLVHRKYELALIGSGIALIVTDPERLANFQNEIKSILK